MPTLRALRESNYISRRKLAENAGVSESTIIRMERGEKRTTEEVIKSVLEALGDMVNKKFTMADVEGINVYDPMRDRKYPIRK